jgi:hypothetical protein
VRSNQPSTTASRSRRPCQRREPRPVGDTSDHGVRSTTDKETTHAGCCLRARSGCHATQTLPDRVVVAPRRAEREAVAVRGVCERTAPLAPLERRTRTRAPSMCVAARVVAAVVEWAALTGGPACDVAVGGGGWCRRVGRTRLARRVPPTGARSTPLHTTLAIPVLEAGLPQCGLMPEARSRPYITSSSGGCPWLHKLCGRPNPKTVCNAGGFITEMSWLRVSCMSKHGRSPEPCTHVA